MRICVTYWRQARQKAWKQVKTAVQPFINTFKLIVLILFDFILVTLAQHCLVSRRTRFFNHWLLFWEGKLEKEVKIETIFSDTKWMCLSDLCQKQVWRYNMSICIAQVCLGDKVPLSDSLIWSMMMCHSLEQRAAISLTNTNSPIVSNITSVLFDPSSCLHCFCERAPKQNCDTNLRWGLQNK